ncbi:viral A-type inclusion protein [Enterococcus mediterraneensis]|uniref:viral A-type inclusion protein n=1 Tax=Enterococcus mediterraneensis TaxID=2364791 RepID=UPI000F069DCC|nr:viral A-type inclusion protein [Enterococcus mediterraneensis]
MEAEEKKQSSETDQASFDAIKEVASKNITQMLHDLQAFETAITEERIPEIYRIYNGRLHEELKKTSNAHHEIDQLLVQKIHDNFMERFPFMVHLEKISETINYYKIGEYYRERATIGIDASIPEIFVIPAVDREWARFNEKEDIVESIERQMDELSAKEIAAQSEIAKLDEKIKELKQKETAIENTKGFFNRGKVDEELAEINDQREKLEAKKAEWLPFVENQSRAGQEKEYLQQEHVRMRLKRAIVGKEFRLIDRYFGSMEEMRRQLKDFLDNYLEGADTDE